MKLHTDLLEEKFGAIHAEIIRQTSEYRYSFLASEDGVPRTCAVTFFSQDDLPPEIAVIHGQIIKGNCIGKTFRDAHIDIVKKARDSFVIELPDWLQKRFQSDSQHARVDVYEFWAGETRYGTIVEVQSPVWCEAVGDGSEGMKDKLLEIISQEPQKTGSHVEF